MITVLGIFLFLITADAACRRGCDLALGSYYVPLGTNFTFISQNLFQTPIPQIISFNPQTPNQDTLIAQTRIDIPFRCDCLNDSFLGHVFNYSVIPSDTYETIAQDDYSNLTTVESLESFNPYPATNIPSSVVLSVIVNCSCGDAKVSTDYGLFVTYPIRVGDTVESVASERNLSVDLVRSFNPNVNFSAGSGLLFLPARGQNGKFPPLNTSTGGLPHAGSTASSLDSDPNARLSGKVIAGISVAGVAVLFLFGACFYVRMRKKKNIQQIQLLPAVSEDQLQQSIHAPGGASVKAQNTASARENASPGFGITVDKSVEFSYEELANATNDFSIANKIGEGGFGSVYYAELRGEKAAIKKMDMQATKEFLSELKVLTNVHHLNLVRLIGYCVEGSLFLVYEYIENGNLSQHLRGSGQEPLSWSTRIQIALDSARGLEYIHEHTVPVYIHRDIKPANILIDKNFHAKVADFGLTKLTEVGSNSLPTGRLVGTFGYMPPEYAQYGDVSPKVDVYAFGVVLFELISAKEAIVKGESAADSKGLVALFEEVLSKPDPSEGLRKLVDPKLGDDYPIDSVQKMAALARACTHETAQLRPTMRSIVVALMTLSSATEDWDMVALYGNQSQLNLMSGR